MTDRPDLVIDGDGHVIEVDATYERIDPQYRERRPRYTQAGRGYIVRLIDGKVWGPETDIGFVGVNGNLPPPKGKAIHYRRMGTYNPWARLADMDRDQIDAAVIYPTDELPLTVTRDAGFAAARAQAYNDWLHDYCEVCPSRLKGVGLVALNYGTGCTGVDCGPAGTVRVRPVHGLRQEPDVTGRPVDMRRRLVHVEGGRQHAVTYRLDHLDHTRHTRSRLRVTDVRLDRAEPQWLVFRPALTVGCEQRLRLDRVAQRGAGAVGFHEVHVGRGEPGIGQRLPDDPLL